MKIFLTVFAVFAGTFLLSCGNTDNSNKPATNSVSLPMNGSMQMNATNIPQSAGMTNGTNAAILICPVTGDTIAPGEGIVYQQNGYEFTLCCAACVNSVKKDFEKYKSKGKKIQ
ncbi:MAG: hypothetical protein A2014_08445 [Spirochaetes bacterium GWF1_49_6]|nr:MAG: hypothetical protein A2014_08445 [Spirochaetes bacterium GWF1_49_6]